jgi:hypothetical protein
MWGDARGTCASGGGDKPGLGNAEAVGLIAAAHFRVLGLKGADYFGGYGGGLSHAYLSCDSIGWLHRAAGRMWLRSAGLIPRREC